MKDNAWSGLYKIPAEEVIKELRLDLGKANAYISELEEKIELYESEQHILKSKKDNLANVERLEKELTKVKKQLKDTRNRFADCEKSREHFKKELFKSMKL